MKIITYLIMFMFSVVVLAQGFSVNSYLERTIVGPKLGTAIGYHVKSGIEVGGFYQEAVQGTVTETDRPWRYERQFYGAFFTYPVVSRNFFNLGFNVRTGISNGENFVITPSLLSSISPIKPIRLGIGIGARALRPTLQGSITIRLGQGSPDVLLVSN